MVAEACSHNKRNLFLGVLNTPTLESLRELYDKDIAEPDLNIINVTGMTCVGVPMGSPEFCHCVCSIQGQDPPTRRAKAPHRP